MSGGALGQRVPRRRRPVRAQPAAGAAIAGYVRIGGYPALELRKVLPAERAFEVGIERQREPALGLPICQGRPAICAVLTGAEAATRVRWGMRDTSHINSSAINPAAKNQASACASADGGTPGPASEWKEVSVSWQSPAALRQAQGRRLDAARRSIFSATLKAHQVH